MIHRSGVPAGPDQTAVEPTAVDILRAHQWEKGGCACGWSQHSSRRERRVSRHNHPHHVAHMLETRSLTYPPAIEFSPEWGDSFTWERPLRWR